MLLNESAYRRSVRLTAQSELLRVAPHVAPCGSRWIDCGIRAPGGMEAGLALARICLGGLGRVSLVSGGSRSRPDSLAVQVRSDHPVAACLAAQYAGWRVASGKFFAMGSGPMRAAAAREALFDRIGRRERAKQVVGALETRQEPPDAVFRELADACGVSPPDLTLLVAPTASMAGTIQVVARSLETALHKLLELDFDLERLVGGWGVAPLPPFAASDLEAIGRTNDAILYGADVTLLARGDDASLAAIGPRAVSCASPAYGRPFAAIFEQAGRDFYRIDPGLFCPARLTFQNVDTGKSLRFGRFAEDVLDESFGAPA